MPFKKGTSGNPSGRPRRDTRHDGWSSVLTGLGTARDKRTSVSFSTCGVTDREARELWRGDDLCARAIEVYPDEMLRAGYDVSIQADDEDGGADRAREQAEAVEEYARRLGADEASRTALMYERAYGGGAIFPVINDSAGDLSLPLNENAIPEIKRLITFEACELQARTYYADPLREKYGDVETFSLQPVGIAGSQRGAASLAGKVIHESRLILFPGIQVSRATVAARGTNAGWGDSVLTRVHETIRDFNAGFGSINHLLQDFSQAVLAIRGLHDAVATNNADFIKNRVIAMDAGRSVLRALLLDAGGDGKSPESFARIATPISGVSEVLDRMIQRLASALEMPVTLLMGTSPNGLSPTGNSDMQFFYTRVARAQDKHLRPRLERLIKLIFLSKTGPTKGEVPDKWCVEFCPLWQPTQKEVVDARFVQAQVDKLYFDMGLPAEDVFRSRFSGDGYSFDTKVDLAVLERAIEQEQAAKLAADAARRQTPLPAQGKPAEDDEEAA